MCIRKYLPVVFFVGFFICVIIVIQVFAQAISHPAPYNSSSEIKYKESEAKQDVSVKVEDKDVVNKRTLHKNS